jgi:diamine N-acetyltransferase
MFDYQHITLENLPLLQEIGRATYEPYYPHVWQPGGMAWYMNHCFGTEALTRDLSNASLEYYIVRDSNAQAAALLKLWPEKTLPTDPGRRAFYLEKIYLMPAWFGKGAGQTMMQWVIRRAAAFGHDTLYLYVMKTGPVKAYERLGFRIIGETDFGFELLQPHERFGWLMELSPLEAGK